MISDPQCIKCVMLKKHFIAFFPFIYLHNSFDSEAVPRGKKANPLVLKRSVFFLSVTAVFPHERRD